jgi:hypothetical protein
LVLLFLLFFWSIGKLNKTRGRMLEKKGEEEGETSPRNQDCQGEGPVVQP